MADAGGRTKVDGPVLAPRYSLFILLAHIVPKATRVALLPKPGKRLRGRVHLIVMLETRETAKLMQVVLPPDRRVRQQDTSRFKYCTDAFQAAVLALNGLYGSYLPEAGRSEERRVGKEWVSTCESGWSPNH